MYVLRIYELERRVKTPDKYMFPYYEPLHWYTAEYILLYLKGNPCVSAALLPVLPFSSDRQHLSYDGVWR